MLFEVREIEVDKSTVLNVYRNKLLMGRAVQEADILFFYDLDGNLAGTFPNFFLLGLALCLE